MLYKLAVHTTYPKILTSQDIRLKLLLQNIWLIFQIVWGNRWAAWAEHKAEGSRVEKDFSNLR